MPFRPGFYKHTELKPAPAPKLKKPIKATVPQIRDVVAAIRVEFPWFADTEKNLLHIFDWLQENEAAGGFTLGNVKVAVQLLEPVLDHSASPPPPKPPAPPPFDWNSLSDTDELPLNTPSWRVRKATVEQVRSFLKRARAAGKK